MGEDFKFLIGKKKKHPTREIDLEYLQRTDAICVLVFDYSMENVYLVKQYRAGSDCDMLEVVAGLIDEGEKTLDAMYRELAEETGFQKTDVCELFAMPTYQYATPGYSTEKLYFYSVRLNENAAPIEQNLDETEDIEVVKISVDEALNVANDMKTTLAISYFSGLCK